MESGEDAFDPHEGDLVLDPAVEEVEDKGPNGFKVLVFNRLPADFNHFQVHVVNHNSAPRLHWLADDSNWHVVLAILGESSPRIDNPFN